MVFTSHLKAPRSLAAHVCLTLFNSAFLRFIWPYQHSTEHKEHTRWNTNLFAYYCSLNWFSFCFFFIFYACGWALLRFCSLVTVTLMRSEREGCGVPLRPQQFKGVVPLSLRRWQHQKLGRTLSRPEDSPSNIITFSLFIGWLLWAKNILSFVSKTKQN